MAKVSAVQRNKKRIKLANSKRKTRDEVRSKLKSKDISPQERLELVFKMQKLPKNSSKIRVRNRCEITGRPRGVYRDFGLSRNKLRELAAFGVLPGLTKASW
jgi:small subunit ribosomal protein S14